MSLVCPLPRHFFLSSCPCRLSVPVCRLYHALAVPPSVSHMWWFAMYIVKTPDNAQYMWLPSYMSDMECHRKPLPVTSRHQRRCYSCVSHP